MNIQETSKFISLILRHKPETIGLRLMSMAGQMLTN